MQRLIYITNSRIPTERAHGIQIVKMCEALAKNGMNVTLLLPRRRNGIKDDIFTYYNIPRCFNIIKLPALDLVGWHIPFAFHIVSISFAVSSLLWLLFNKGNAFVYARGEMALFFAGRFLRYHRFFWETHIMPENMARYEKVLTKNSGIIVVTEYYRQALLELGVDRERILVAPDGADIGVFDIEIDKREARSKTGLPLDKRIVLTSSSDLSWKGLSILRSAIPYLPDDVITVFVGDVNRVDENEDKALFVGYRTYQDMPLWLKSADVLILTGDPMSDIARFYTSPLKLFEYMASDRPIVAIDIPSFRDILDVNNAFFSKSDTGRGLAAAIMGALERPECMLDIANRAKRDVRKYSWDNRANSIIDFMNRNI